MSKSENAEERPVTGRSRLRSYGGQAVWAQVQAPRTEAELAAVLRAACAAGQPVTFHAAGRSFDTQALNDTMVVSLRLRAAPISQRMASAALRSGRTSTGT